MKQKFSYLLNKKMEVQGREIFCKVTGAPGSANDGMPYVLAITGGPGFSHELTESYLRRILPIAEKEQAMLPHFIFFDNLGCGQSDKAKDPDKEYTVDHFTQLSASLVEVIKKELNLSQMNLFIEGGSFGSLVAMNFPACKPEWLNEDAEISLKQITSKVGPKGAGMWDYTYNFLQRFKDHPNYEKIIAAQKKLFAGDMQSQLDYVQNFVLPMESLYLKDNNPSRFKRAMRNLVETHPALFSKGVHLINNIRKKFGLETEGLNFVDVILNGCSIEVLNHFFKKDFDGFDILEVVKRNKDLYKKIPICLISASEDHIVDAKIAENINNELKDTSAVIIFKEAHMLSKGPNKAIFDKLNYDLLVHGHIPPADVNAAVIGKQTVSSAFNTLLGKAHEYLVTLNVKGGTTTNFLERMPSGRQVSVAVPTLEDRAPQSVATSEAAPDYANETLVDESARQVLRPC